VADESAAIEIPVVVTGEEAAQQALNQTAGAVTKVGTAARGIVDPLKQAEAAAAKKAQTAGKLSSVVGTLSPVIGRVSGDAAKLTQVFSTAGATITGLTSVIGGPFGIAIGAAVAATGLLITSMNEAEAAAKAEADAVAGATISLDDYIASAERAIDVRKRDALIASGGGSVGQQQGALDAKQAELDAANRQADAARARVAQLQRAGVAGGRAGGEAEDTLRAIEARRGALEEETRALRGLVDVAKAREELENSAPPPAEIQARHERAVSNSDEIHDRLEREAIALAKIRKEADEAYQALLRAGGADKAGPGIFDKASNLPKNDNGGEFKGGRDADAVAAEQFQKDQEANARAAEESAARIEDAYTGAGLIVEDAFAAAFSAIVTGQDVAVAAVLKGIGQTLVADGIQNGLKGVARGFSSYGFDATAYGLIEVGALEVAAGIGFGAAGSAVSGGGGSSGPPSQPTSPRDNANENTSGQQTIVVNYNSTFAPNAQDGRRVTKSLRKLQYAQGVGGRR
jgi:hypothetical protein